MKLSGVGTAAANANSAAALRGFDPSQFFRSSVDKVEEEGQIDSNIV
jgi:hypothetical protein